MDKKIMDKNLTNANLAATEKTLKTMILQHGGSIAHESSVAAIISFRYEADFSYVKWWLHENDVSYDLQHGRSIQLPQFVLRQPLHNFSR